MTSPPTTTPRESSRFRAPSETCQPPLHYRVAVFYRWSCACAGGLVDASTRLERGVKESRRRERHERHPRALDTWRHREQIVRSERRQCTTEGVPRDNDACTWMRFEEGLDGLSYAQARALAGRRALFTPRVCAPQTKGAARERTRAEPRRQPRRARRVDGGAADSAESVGGEGGEPRREVG